MIPLAKPKLLDFKPPKAVSIEAGDQIDNAKIVKIVGKANVEHLRWVIGNYWEKKLAALDTDKLFDELRILFHSKRKAKVVMNETREEIAARVIDVDWNRIWLTFSNKLHRLIWRKPKTEAVLAQVVQLQNADLVIEENSTCEVTFQGHNYVVDVDGRRSVIGLATAIKGDRVRVMRIKNRFVGRTFWQCQGRQHVYSNEPGLFDALE